MGQVLRPVAVGLAGMALNIILSLILSRPAAQGGMGHAGLALANSIATLLEMVALAILLGRKLSGLPWGELARSVGCTILASLAMGLTLWSVVYFLGDVSAWAATIAGVLGGGAVFLLAALVLGAPEPASLARILRRR